MSGLLARIEVNIDFPGEDPEAELSREELKGMLSRAADEIEKLLASADRGKFSGKG